MSARAQLAAVQIAVFVAGGLVAPVVHLASHRPDHTHGPGGQAIAFEIDHRRSLPTAHSHHHASAQHHSHSGAAHHHAPGPSLEHRSPPHSHLPGPSRPGETTATAPLRRGEGRADPLEAQPVDPTHGHGSLAHLGLALLSAPPPLALPAPERAGVVERAAHPRAATLFEPVFPLPRPPPAAPRHA